MSSTSLSGSTTSCKAGAAPSPGLRKGFGSFIWIVFEVLSDPVLDVGIELPWIFDFYAQFDV